MSILLKNKLKCRMNTVIYGSVFTVVAVVFTVSAFATQHKTEYVHEDEPVSYAVDISGIDLDKVEAVNDSQVEEETTVPETTEEETTKDMSDYKGVFVSNTTGNLNVRAMADPNSDVVGVLEENNGGKVLEYGTQWTKIKSGKVVGYVATGYIAIGKKAKKILNQTSQVAVVNTDTLMVRKKNNKNSDILGMVGKGETFKVVDTTDKWVKINYDGKKGYLNKKYIKLDTDISHGKTIEEIDAIRTAEAEAEAARKQAEYEAAVAQQAANEQATTTQKQQTTTKATPAPTTAASNNAPAPQQRQEVSANVDDAYLLACLVTCEAGNQPYEGKLAVANVVLNRVASSRYPNTISGVIYQSGQFGPAYTTLPGRLQSGPDSGSLQAAQAALAGNNNVPGYYSFNVNSAIDTSRLNSYKIIGAHTFY